MRGPEPQQEGRPCQLGGHGAKAEASGLGPCVFCAGPPGLVPQLHKVLITGGI